MSKKLKARDVSKFPACDWCDGGQAEYQAWDWTICAACWNAMEEEVYEGYKERTLKVKDLLEKLNGVDPEMMVLVAKDSEGNDFAPFDEVTACTYNPSGHHGGHVDHEVKGANAVILWPNR